jgi:hypothetical protein
MVHLPNSMPMDLQMALAKGSLAVPLKIFTRCNDLDKKTARVGGRLKRHCNNFIGGCAR